MRRSFARRIRAFAKSLDVEVRSGISVPEEFVPTRNTNLDDVMYLSGRDEASQEWASPRLAPGFRFFDAKPVVQ